MSEPAPLGSMGELAFPLRQHEPMLGFQFLRQKLSKDSEIIEAAEQPNLFSAVRLEHVVLAA
jgi:hypothetical protein